MNILKSKVIALITPDAKNPRNSEGSFIRLDDGRIAYAYSRYIGNTWYDHGECEIACIYSYDNGETFDTERIETLVRAEEHGQKNVMSVTLRRMNNGDIGLFYLLKIHSGGLRTHYYLRRYKGDFSHPCGEVKTAPTNFPGYYVINNDRVEKTSDGKWIVPAAYHPTALCTEESTDTDWCDPRSTVFCFVSEDDGVTWRSTDAKVSLNDPYSKTGLQEPGIVELPGGALYLYSRTDRMYQYESLSLDGGEHFTAPAPSKFSSPRSPMLIKRNPYNSKYYAIWNPVPEYPGRPTVDGCFLAGRSPLVIADSDDGLNFSQFAVVEDDPTRGFCYPAMEFIDEHAILIAYCSGGKEDGGCLNRVTIRKIVIR